MRAEEHTRALYLVCSDNWSRTHAFSHSPMKKRSVRPARRRPLLQGFGFSCCGSLYSLVLLDAFPNLAWLAVPRSKLRREVSLEERRHNDCGHKDHIAGTQENVEAKGAESEDVRTPPLFYVCVTPSSIS
jgi:hypothetical protein